MAAAQEFFPNIKKIAFNPNAGPDETLVYRHYNADEIVNGRSMADWLRFAVCYWHTFRGKGLDIFGAPTIKRHFDDESPSMENAKRRLRAAFEFMQKLGVRYWTFHDRDLVGEGKDLAETNRMLDEISDLALELQKQTGIKCLWGTANLFSNPRYANGAATNPDANVFAYAAAQVKKAIEITQKLGGENYVFWGGREGFASLLNTDARRELDHLAAFFHLAIGHCEKIGFKGQLLIEPKPKEPTKHQYDYDAQTVIGFLLHYKLDKHFKLNIEPNHTTMAGHSYEHDVEMASRYGFLGSIDSNTGDASLGWDTDQFPMNLKDCALLVKTILTQGGIAPGGLNFDAKVRRESTEDEDLFIAHIGAMDCFALALRKVAKLHSAGVLQNLVKARYASFDSGLGAKVEAKTTSFEELSAHVLALPAGQQEPKPISGQQEKYEALFNNYLH
jgi:xylose isomerase